MRVGVLCGPEISQLEWAQRLGFRSVEIVRFADSAMSPQHQNWKPAAEQFAAEAKSRDIRISAIGAYYKNPLDPKQTAAAQAILHRAIDVASHIGVKTVCGFAGAVIETQMNERGGNPVYKPFEDFLPQLFSFWFPIAQYAADHGVRIAFENCPQGSWHLPIDGYNMFAQPAIWERVFNTIKSENIGIEWDASHLICQFIDPIENIRRFGPRIFHVHAKDAYINRQLLEVYGICHPGVAEHRMVGLGQSNWAEIVSSLLRAGYDSDLNIEGRHDPVYRDHDAAQPDDVKSHGINRQQGQKLEEAGLLIAKKVLEQYTAGTE
jgi:sugar phosphate isomerase/epimerase